MANMNGFIHGINIGGWLSQCVHTKEHYDSFIHEDDMKVIKSWGLDHVRLPVDYNLVQDKAGNFKEEGFSYIQNVIDWCKAAGLNMILDLHKTAGYSFDDGEKETGFFDNEKYQNQFYSLWTEFAKRYSKYEDMLCFELLNEVTSKDYCKTWNAIAKTCIENIRKISPSIKILVGSYWNNHVGAVRDLDMPYDSNIVYNFHCYEPLVFTHQGATWIPKMDPEFRMKLEAPYSDYDKFSKTYISIAGDTFDKYNPNETVTEKYFENLFEDAIAVAKERNVLLYCGEYGVIDRANPKDVLKWFKMINNVFEKNNIGHAIWSYKKMDFGMEDDWIASVRDDIMKSSGELEQKV